MHLGERWANGAEANFAVPHRREASGSHMSGTSAGPARTGTTEGNRCRSIKRFASAVGDGATAVRLVHEYLAAEHADEPALAVGT